MIANAHKNHKKVSVPLKKYADEKLNLKLSKTTVTN